MTWHDVSAILAIIALGSGALVVLFFTDINVIDFGFGILLGIGLYSVFWRWRYGYWPD